MKMKRQRCVVLIGIAALSIGLFHGCGSREDSGQRRAAEPVQIAPDDPAYSNKPEKEGAPDIEQEGPVLRLAPGEQS